MARGAPAASEAVLRELARALDAPLAALWLRDETSGLLRFAHDWATDGTADELRRIAPRLTFAPGVGLPGRILATLEPRVVEDLAADPEFPRVDVALRAGMRSALGAPLLTPSGPLGVIEVFGRETGAPAAGALEDVAMAAGQLAAFLARVRTEDLLRASEETSATIVSAALDCIITMDHRGIVLDFNPAAEATFGYERAEAVGRSLTDLIIPPDLRDAHQRALDAYVRGAPAAILGRRLELPGQRADGSIFPVELTVTRLGAREPPVFAGFIRDITERRDAERQLARLLEREQAARARAEQAEQATREVAEVLQRSLLPPRLPEISGLELGAAYRAGTAGWEAGGDFYDVFKLGIGRWAVAIGDVCGKGPRAASLTAMVRYAMRHAAVREASPSAVLGVVNDALLRDAEGEVFTAIFATVDLAGDGASVCMAAGGHPLPLLARADGSVDSVGRPGTLLGAFAGARAVDTEFVLGPGELALFFTDGLTEARVATGRLGESGLRSLLARTADRHPQEVADRIDSEVQAARIGGTGDDIAILALRARGS